MGGRWRNFNFKIVGNRFFFLATVAKLRVEFSALLHGQKNYTEDTRSNQTQLGSTLGKAEEIRYDPAKKKNLRLQTTP
jgi:hypothetical protein